MKKVNFIFLFLIIFVFSPNNFCMDDEEDRDNEKKIRDKIEYFYTYYYYLNDEESEGIIEAINNNNNNNQYLLLLERVNINSLSFPYYIKLFYIFNKNKKKIKEIDTLKRFFIKCFIVTLKEENIDKEYISKEDIEEMNKVSFFDIYFPEKCYGRESCLPHKIQKILSRLIKTSGILGILFLNKELRGKYKFKLPELTNKNKVVGGLLLATPLTLSISLDLILKRNITDKIQKNKTKLEERLKK